MYTFFRQYGATPHSTISVSPSKALNNRKLNPPDPSSTPSNTRQMRSYAKPNETTPSQTTLPSVIRSSYGKPKLNKLSTLFDPEPFRVVAVKDTMITARKSSFFKKIPHLPVHLETSDDDDSSPITQPEQPPSPSLRRFSRQAKQSECYGYQNMPLAPTN